MLHIYAGDGKGKTTAAFGLALRFAGSGGKALIIQFLKGMDSGEVTAVRSVAGIEVFNAESPHSFYFSMDDGERSVLKRELELELNYAMKCAAGGEYGLIVLDEALDAIGLGLIEEHKLMELVAATESEIVLTGRGPSERLILAADYYTYFDCKKHPYSNGVPARRGIEY